MNFLSDILSSVILGVIEGLTEFIPVSSSGHLIIARHLLGLQTDGGLAFDAVLQFATVLAVLVYFWKDLWGLLVTFLKWVGRKPVETASKTQLFAIIVGTIPAVILGFLLESHMEEWFRSVGLVAIAMLAGSVLMWWAERHASKNLGKIGGGVSIKDGLKIGLYQCLALIPGVSRSGATISGGLLSGIDRAVATRFSFLLSFPIIAGSGAKKLLELIKTGALSAVGVDLLVASVVAFVVGLAAIHFLIKYLRTHTMAVFIWYRVAFAVLVLITLALVQ
jgi:undecaprenyl-diphosphatase